MRRWSRTPRLSFTASAALAKVALATAALFAASSRAADLTDSFRPADTSSPRAVLSTFIDSCNELSDLLRSQKYYDRSDPVFRQLAERIIDCLDTSELPEFARADRSGETAVCLKEVLDRVALPPWERIPDEFDVANAEDSRPLERYQIPGTRIVIARVQEGPRRYEYLFSPGTVRRIVDDYNDLRSVDYRTSGPSTTPGLHRWYFSNPGRPVISHVVDRLPEWFRDRWFGMTLWKWPGLLLLAFATIAVMGWAYRRHRRLLSSDDLALSRLWTSLSLLIIASLAPLALRELAGSHLSIRGTPMYVISFVANSAAFLALIAVVAGLGNRIAATVISSPAIHPQGLDAQFIRFLCRLGTLGAAAIIFLEGGRYLGIPISTLLAGAGIGGLAIALAAQGMLKDLLGTLTILLDKPYRVGDRVVVAGYDGYVSEVGLRSTKMSLLNGNIATLPNDRMAQSEIENVSRRPHIRRAANLHLPLDTPHEKVAQVADAIREILHREFPDAGDFPPRVGFNEFNQDSLNLRIMCWYAPADYWDFMEASERLNLEILRVLDELGISLVQPLAIARRDEPPSDVQRPSPESPN